MENQHRQIKGYRELTAEEIEFMNKIKQKAAEVGSLVAEMEQTVSAQMARGSNAVDSIVFDPRWIAIGKTELQQGFMALTRAVARPDFF